MRAMRGIGAVAALLIVSTSAMAAWVGNVPDVVNPILLDTLGPNAVCVASTGLEYGSVLEAYGWASEGDTLLMGPGLYQEWNTAQGNSPASPQWCWTKSINLYGSGSAADPNTNTVWQGVRDANNQCFTLEFLTLQGPGYMTLKNFRVQDSGADMIEVSGGVAGSAVHPGFTFNNMAFVRAASRNLFIGPTGLTTPGWGDGITSKESTNALIIQNCLFDGGGNTPQTGGDMFGLRISGTGPVNNNGLVDGCTFQNMKSGIVFNAYKANNWTITNNVFVNMSKATGIDNYNCYGNVGIEFYPRHWTAATADASVSNFLIMSNTFKDCGYLAQEPSDPTPHPWADTLLGEAGIGVTLCTGTSASNIWINHNTFANDGNGGTMKRAVNIVTSDGATYDLTTTPSFTGTYGTLNNFVVGDNTYTGLVDKAIRAVNWTKTGVDANGVSIIGVPATQVNFPNVIVKSAGLANITGITAYGDVNGDGKIDGYDVSNNTTDWNGDGIVDSNDKVYLITKILHTKVGDFNLDGMVDGVDFLAWQSGYPKTNPPFNINYSNGECTWDNKIDGVDFLKWQSAYPVLSNTYYPNNYGPVPEPATIGLLVLGGLAALRRRR